MTKSANVIQLIDIANDNIRVKRWWTGWIAIKQRQSLQEQLSAITELSNMDDERAKEFIVKLCECEVYEGQVYPAYMYGAKDSNIPGTVSNYNLTFSNARGLLRYELWHVEASPNEIRNQFAGAGSESFPNSWNRGKVATISGVAFLPTGYVGDLLREAHKRITSQI